MAASSLELESPAELITVVLWILVPLDRILTQDWTSVKIQNSSPLGHKNWFAYICFEKLYYYLILQGPHSSNRKEVACSELLLIKVEHLQLLLPYDAKINHPSLILYHVSAANQT